MHRYRAWWKGLLNGHRPSTSLKVLPVDVDRENNRMVNIDQVEKSRIVDVDWENCSLVDANRENRIGQLKCCRFQNYCIRGLNKSWGQQFNLIPGIKEMPCIGWRRPLKKCSLVNVDRSKSAVWSTPTVDVDHCSFLDRQQAARFITPMIYWQNHK